MAGFRKAKAEQAAMKVGIYGPAGSGKTFTTLLCAEGLAQHTGKRVAFVDTERGTDFYCKDVPSRKPHPEAFDFDALYTKSLTEIVSAVKGLDPKQYGVVVIDSITHVWEAARLAYEGRTNGAGQIPFHAWGKIKKPYRELVNHLLSSPMHVFILGRQGIDYQEDDEGELKAVGKKMKAEGETAYEPHILVRMEPEKKKDGTAIVRAFIEKDRTGVLAGKVITWPSFDTLCKPILPLLGGTQAKVQSEEEVSEQDAGELERIERERENESFRLHQKFCAKIDLAMSDNDLDGLEGVVKELTAEVKKRMLPAHVNELRRKYRACQAVLKGEVVPAGSQEE